MGILTVGPLCAWDTILPLFSSLTCVQPVSLCLSCYCRVPYYLEQKHMRLIIKPKKDVESTANRRPCAAIRECAFIIKLLTMQLSGVRLIKLCYYNNSVTIQ